MADDDIFADLIGASGFKPLPKPVPEPQLSAQHPSHGSSGAAATSRSAAPGHAGPKEPVLPEPDLLDSALAPAGGSESNGNTSQPQLGLIMSKEELESLVRGVIDAALDTTMSKFVRSLRTVLEDMGRRIEATGAATTSLKDSVEQLRDLFDSQAGNMQARFTSVDLAIREVERGVQSLRDKQELLEAQAMLAKLSTKDAEHKQPETPQSAVAASASTPAAATAPAAPAAAPVAAAPAAEPAAPPYVAPAAAPPAPAAAPAPAAPPPLHMAGPSTGQYTAPPAPAAPSPAQYSTPPPQMTGAPYSAPPAPQQQPPPYQQQQQPGPSSTSSSSSYSMGPLPMLQQGPSGPHPGAYGPPPGALGPPPPGPPGPMGPPPHMPPHAVPHAPPMYGPPPGAPMQQGPPAGPQYPTPPAGAYPPPFRPGPSGPRHAHGGPPPARAPSSGGNTIQQVSLDKVVSDIVAMGFSHGQVMSVVRQMQASGQQLDMNVIIDRCMANAR